MKLSSIEKMVHLPAQEDTNLSGSCKTYQIISCQTKLHKCPWSHKFCEKCPIFPLLHNVAFLGSESWLNHFTAPVWCVFVCNTWVWSVILFVSVWGSSFFFSFDAARPEDAAARWWPCMQYLAHSRVRRAAARSQSLRAAYPGQSACRENELWTLLLIHILQKANFTMYKAAFTKNCDCIDYYLSPANEIKTWLFL